MNKSAYEEAVLKGIERANKEMKMKNKVLKGVIPFVASLTIVSILGTHSEVVSALQQFVNSFGGFSTTLFGEPTDKYEQLAQPIGQTISDKGVIMTVDEVVLDDNYLYFTLTVESEFLKGFEGQNENDFLNLWYGIYVDGTFCPDIQLVKVKQVDETTGLVVLGANISELDLSDQATVKLEIDGLERGLNLIRGQWVFEDEVTKLTEGKILFPEESVIYKEEEVFVKKVVMTSLGNTIILSSNGKSDATWENQLMIVDSNGVEYPTKKSGSNQLKKLEFSGDLSSVEWLEVKVQAVEESVIILNGNSEYSLLQTANTPLSYDQYETISRKSTPKEVSNGYSLDEVTYFVNQSSETPFLALEHFIGISIPVSQEESIIIESVEYINQDAKITFKLPSRYDYYNLNQLVLFDREMQDISRLEGQSMVAIEDEAKGLYSMTLYNVDSSTEYTIAIPLMPELSEKRQHGVCEFH